MPIDLGITTETTPMERTRYLMDVCRIKNTKKNWNRVLNEIVNAVGQERRECSKVTENCGMPCHERTGEQDMMRQAIVMAIERRSKVQPI